MALASLLATTGQYIGDPIDCMVTDIPGDMMDTYCWIHSTFSVPARWVGKQGVDIPHPGISPTADLEEGQEVKYHKWYQWVAFFLFLEVLFFYLPRYIWKSSENGKVKMLIGDLKDPLLDDGAKESQINEIVKYFRSGMLSTDADQQISYIVISCSGIFLNQNIHENAKQCGEKMPSN